MISGAANGAAVELAPPDLAPYRAGNTGLPYVTSWVSSTPGPHVMVTALTHGNEICGAIALDRLFREGIRPAHGRLTFAFANVEAYTRFDPNEPHRSRFIDEDFNRVWATETLDGPRQSMELARARELRPLIDTVDLLLDLHSMTAPSPPMMLTGMCDKSVALARRVGTPEIIMRDSGHADGTRLRDYGRFGDPEAPNIALLMECGECWRRATADTAYVTTLRFLAATGTMERPIDAPAPPQRLLDVTHAVTPASDRFAFARPFHGLEVIPTAGTIIAQDGDRPIVTPYDDCVIIMPSAAAKPGRTAMRLGRFSS